MFVFVGVHFDLKVKQNDTNNDGVFYPSSQVKEYFM